MSILFKIIGFPVLIAGLIEAFPGVFQWFAFLIVNVIGGKDASMDSIAHGSPAYSFLRFHGLPAGFAAPLFLFGGWLLLKIGFSAEEQETAQAAQDTYNRERIKAHREASEREHKQLDAVCEDIEALYEILEPLLDQAALHVTRAESELADDSVGAFWDEIEGATRRFAQYNNSIDTILSLAEDFTKRRELVESEFQPSALEAHAIPDGDHLLSRMSKIVKKARRNPQWETIFQQRRTNDILVRGFESLGNALDSLHDTLSSGLRDLADALHSSVDRITMEHSDRVITELSQFAVTHDEDSRERRRFEQSIKANADKAVQVLEKIENRRRYG